MRIGIDGKVLDPEAGGIGRYAIQLTRALLADAEQTDLELVIFGAPQTSRRVLERLSGPFREHYWSPRSSVLRSLCCLPGAHRRHRLDVFHGLDHVGIPLIRTSGPWVVTVHDVIPLTLPHAFPAKHRFVVRSALSLVAARADRIIVPSDSVRRELLQQVEVAPDRIAVIPEACDERFSPRRDLERFERIARDKKLPASYVLAVGTLEPRKNLVTLLHAFAELRQCPGVDPDLGLVLAGGRAKGDRPLFEAVQALGLAERVRCLGFVEDEDLPELIRGAELFAFPSLSEGFGLPLLEALACGVPAVASNRSAMPEVAGDAAVLVDTTDVHGLAGALHRVLTDGPLRAELRRRGPRQAGRFSWRATARATREVYAALRSSSADSR